MYKRVGKFEVQYGKFRDAMKALENMESLWRKKGLTPGRTYVLEFGKANMVMSEWEYKDFGQYERDTKAFLTDEEVRAAWTEVRRHVVPDSLQDELWRPSQE